MQQGRSLEKLEERLKAYGDNVTILEEEINLELQMQYFKESKAVKRDLDVSKVLINKDKLYDDDISFEEKRRLLSCLASVKEVEAFRTLEAYLKNPDKTLSEWSILAYQESKMLLQSSLVDQPPLFISTGLGGKGTKLRYFAVVRSKKCNSLTDLQQGIIKKELEYAFKNAEAELEDLAFHGHFAILTCLVPLKVGLKGLFSDIIHKCNELGGFLDTSLMISNSRKLKVTEVEDAIQNNSDS